MARSGVVANRLKEADVWEKARGSGQMSGNPCVLLVEDEFLIRMALVDVLSDYDIDCQQAGTGKKAIEAIEGSSRIDAIVVDMGLPDMSGQKVIEAALARRPGTPLVRCSGSSLPTAAEPLPPGVHVFPKPYIASKLAEFLKTLVKPS
jgi:CheY-like chemotaxis protein